MSVEITHGDRVLFPASGITKADLCGWYEEAAGLLLRHAGARALSFKRCPDGIEDCFFQKNRPDGLPDAIASVTVPTDSGSLEQVVVRRRSDVVRLANLGCLEWHAPLSRVDDDDRPDMVVFDLDPPATEAFDLARRAARAVRDRLAQGDLDCLVKTTGSKGLHVVVPIRPEHDFETIRGWAREQAEALAGEHGDWLTTEIRKDRRGDRVFIDTARNARGQTVVAPYSVRAIEGAPVATPLDWNELDRIDDARHYRIDNLPRRLGQKDDPWAGFGRRRQRLAP